VIPSAQFSRRQARRSKSKATHEALLAVFRGVDCDSFLALFGAKTILDTATATNHAEQIRLFEELVKTASEVRAATGQAGLLELGFSPHDLHLL
jgi:hypothetical protein